MIRVKRGTIKFMGVSFKPGDEIEGLSLEEEASLIADGVAEGCNHESDGNDQNDSKPIVKMTKDELLEFVVANGIEGVTDGMTKAEIIKAIDASKSQE